MRNRRGFPFKICHQWTVGLLVLCCFPADTHGWLSWPWSEQPAVYETVSEGLKQVYKEKILPLEEHYHFHDFHSPKLTDSDFDAKPMILLVGQYSTGKTTLIQYLLGREYPGLQVGPEPTTDGFVAVMHGEQDKMIFGNVLVVDPNKQFRSLEKYGKPFLDRFKCAVANSSVLRGISIIDTPGILSGIERAYDFNGVLEWFAERADRIILMFDPHKLDISNEFRRGIEAIKQYDEKIRIVLNKADMMDHQQLMRAYGAIMWSLGTVLKTPEVPRVYIGSFWDKPLRNEANKKLFEDEKRDLLQDLNSVAKNFVVRKLNDLIKRVKLAKVHAYIISHLHDNAPYFFVENGKRQLLDRLHLTIEKLHLEHQLSSGDFPDIERMKKLLTVYDWDKFSPLNQELIDSVDKVLTEDIAVLTTMTSAEKSGKSEGHNLCGGAFNEVEHSNFPCGGVGEVDGGSLTEL